MRTTSFARVILYLLTGLLIGTGLSRCARADEPKPPPKQEKAFTDEDRRQALEALQTMKQFFEQKQPQAQPAQPEQPKPDHKTVADVADKALDFSIKYIGQAAAVIEKAAPHVWQVMVLQQYAKAIGNVIEPGLWVVMVLVVAAAARHFWKVQDDKWDDKGNRLQRGTGDDERTARMIVTVVVPGIGCVIAGGFFVNALASSAMYLINPQYYAIRDLVQILLHPGSL